MALLACNDSSRPVAPPIAQAHVDASRAADARVETAPSVLAAVAGRGAVLGEPLDVGEGQRIVFVESPLHAARALLVKTHADGAPIVSDLGLPTASRVVFATVWRGKPFALVESLAALDQPAGLRTVVRLLRGPAEGDYSLAQRARLGQSATVADLDRRLEQVGPSPSADARDASAEETMRGAERAGAVGEKALQRPEVEPGGGRKLTDKILHAKTTFVPRRPI